MGTTLFVIIGVVSIAAFAFAHLTKTSRQPPVIVQFVPESESRSIGFLPLIVIAIIIYVIVRLLAGS